MDDEEDIVEGNSGGDQAFSQEPVIEEGSAQDSTLQNEFVESNDILPEKTEVSPPEVVSPVDGNDPPVDGNDPPGVSPFASAEETALKHEESLSERERDAEETTELMKEKAARSKQEILADKVLLDNKASGSAYNIALGADNKEVYKYFEEKGQLDEYYKWVDLDKGRVTFVTSEITPYDLQATSEDAKEAEYKVLRDSINAGYWIDSKGNYKTDFFELVQDPEDGLKSIGSGNKSTVMALVVDDYGRRHLQEFEGTFYENRDKGVLLHAEGIINDRGLFEESYIAVANGALSLSRGLTELAVTPVSWFDESAKDWLKESSYDRMYRNLRVGTNHRGTWVDTLSQGISEATEEIIEWGIIAGLGLISGGTLGAAGASAKIAKMASKYGIKGLKYAKKLEKLSDAAKLAKLAKEGAKTGAKYNKVVNGLKGAGGYLGKASKGVFNQVMMNGSIEGMAMIGNSYSDGIASGRGELESIIYAGISGALETLSEKALAKINPIDKLKMYGGPRMFAKELEVATKAIMNGEAEAGEKYLKSLIKKKIRNKMVGDKMVQDMAEISYRVANNKKGKLTAKDLIDIISESANTVAKKHKGGGLEPVMVKEIADHFEGIFGGLSEKMQKRMLRSGEELMDKTYQRFLPSTKTLIDIADKIGSAGAEGSEEALASILHYLHDTIHDSVMDELYGYREDENGRRLAFAKGNLLEEIKDSFALGAVAGGMSHAVMKRVLQMEYALSDPLGQIKDKMSQESYKEAIKKLDELKKSGQMDDTVYEEQKSIMSAMFKKRNTFFTKVKKAMGLGSNTELVDILENAKGNGRESLARFVASKLSFLEGKSAQAQGLRNFYIQLEARENELKRRVESGEETGEELKALQDEMTQIQEDLTYLNTEIKNAEDKAVSDLKDLGETFEGLGLKPLSLKDSKEVKALVGRIDSDSEVTDKEIEDVVLDFIKKNTKDGSLLRTRGEFILVTRLLERQMQTTELQKANDELSAIEAELDAEGLTPEQREKIETRVTEASDKRNAIAKSAIEGYLQSINDKLDKSFASSERTEQRKKGNRTTIRAIDLFSTMKQRFLGSGVPRNVANTYKSILELYPEAHGNNNAAAQGLNSATTSLGEGDTFFLSTPNEDGSFNDSSASVSYREGASIYKFTKTSSTTAKFRVAERETTMKQAIGSPSSYLKPVSEIKNTFSTKKVGIGTLEEGEAELENGTWKVVKKATIKYLEKDEQAPTPQAEVVEPAPTPQEPTPQAEVVEPTPTPQAPTPQPQEETVSTPTPQEPTPQPQEDTAPAPQEPTVASEDPVVVSEEKKSIENRIVFLTSLLDTVTDEQERADIISEIESLTQKARSEQKIIDEAAKLSNATPTPQEPTTGGTENAQSGLGENKVAKPIRGGDKKLGRVVVIDS